VAEKGISLPAIESEEQEEKFRTPKKMKDSKKKYVKNVRWGGEEVLSEVRAREV